jgi:Iron-containing redox enzyme
MSTLERTTARGARSIELPVPRGPWSERLFAALQREPCVWIEASGLPRVADPLGDHDLQLALYTAYELHYSAICDVDPRWEWSPALLAFRAEIELQFDRGVRELVSQRATQSSEVLDVGETLQRIVAEDDGPALSRYMETQGTFEQMLEHVVHRSAYQLKEADPHSWAIPRLSGPVKSALLEIQFDEYGGGHPERMHSTLFAKTMRALGLNDSYGAYLPHLPGITLATVNLLSGFGLHRGRRGALVGHLAAFEMTSSIPNRRYANALRRFGRGCDVTDFYDEHVEADAVHENIAAWDLAGGLARSEPALTQDILFGARALLALEARWASHLLDAWRRGESSLLTPLRLKPTSGPRLHPSPERIPV